MKVQIDSAGTMTIPQTIRDTLGVPAGEVELRLDEKGRTYIERAKPLPKQAPPTPRDGLDRVRGSLKTDMTTDEMMKFLRGDEE